MKKCTCPADYRQIPSTKRVTVELRPPVRTHDEVQYDLNNILFCHADCPVHGYTVLYEGVPAKKEAA